MVKKILVKYEYLNARRREKDFLVRLDTKYINRHEDIAKKVHEGIAKLEVAHEGETEVIALLKDIDENFTKYEGVFDFLKIK